MPYQHFNALRSSRLAYKYFTEKWNQMSPAGAYLVKVRVPVNNSHRKSTQGCPTRWRSRFISDPGPIILLPCHSLIHHSVCVLQTELKFAQDFSKLLHGSFKKWIGFVKLLHIFLAQTHPFLTRILKLVKLLLLLLIWHDSVCNVWVWFGYYFFAVQGSSIGDLVTHSVIKWVSEWVTFDFSVLRALWL